MSKSNDHIPCPHLGDLVTRDHIRGVVFDDGKVKIWYRTQGGLLEFSDESYRSMAASIASKFDKKNCDGEDDAGCADWRVILAAGPCDPPGTFAVNESAQLDKAMSQLDPPVGVNPEGFPELVADGLTSSTGAARHPHPFSAPTAAAAVLAYFLVDLYAVVEDHNRIHPNPRDRQAYLDRKGVLVCDTHGAVLTRVVDPSTQQQTLLYHQINANVRGLGCGEIWRQVTSCCCCFGYSQIPADALVQTDLKYNPVNVTKNELWKQVVQFSQFRSDTVTAVKLNVEPFIIHSDVREDGNLGAFADFGQRFVQQHTRFSYLGGNCRHFSLAFAREFVPFNQRSGWLCCPFWERDITLSDGHCTCYTCPCWTQANGACCMSLVGCARCCCRCWR